MKIKNLTNRIQKLWITNPREGNRSLCVEVRPGNCREILDSYPDLNKMPDFDKYFAIVTGDNQIISNTKQEEKIINPQPVEDPKIEETQISEPTETQEPTVIESQFTCEICGAEFASARGLASHMSRTHQEDN